MFMQAKLVKQLPVANQLGEGVLWDQPTGCIWWVDILSSKLFRYSLADDELSDWSTPEPLCSFALVDGRSDIFAAFASGIAWFDVNTGAVDWIQKIEADNPRTRLNDGKADLHGNFWVGGVVEDAPESEGDSQPVSLSSLYRIDSKLSVVPQLGGIRVSNGLCWSPCGRYLYHTDTPTQTIRRYELGADGGLLNGIDFAKTEEGCFPDGSTTDAKGKVYNAEWDGFKVRCYNTDGTVDFDLSMPVSRPTCVAFVGDDLSLMAVTSAAVGIDLQSESGAGDLFIYQTDQQGFHHPRFKAN